VPAKDVATAPEIYLITQIDFLGLGLLVAVAWFGFDGLSSLGQGLDGSLLQVICQLLRPLNPLLEFVALELDAPPQSVSSNLLGARRQA